MTRASTKKNKNGENNNSSTPPAKATKAPAKHGSEEKPKDLQELFNCE